jgi:hypothetical protein
MSESPLKSAMRKLTASAPSIVASASATDSTTSTGAAASAAARSAPTLTREVDGGCTGSSGLTGPP